MKVKSKPNLKIEKKVDHVFDVRRESMRSFSSAKRIPKHNHFAVDKKGK